jgi:hypothetical protein
MEVKTCSKCGEEKPVSAFGKHSARSDGLRSRCKPCNNADAQQYASDNREAVLKNKRRYYAENKERFSEYYAERMDDESFRERKAAAARQWYRENKDRRKDYGKAHYKNNKPVYMAHSAKRRASKKQQTPSWANEQTIRAFYKEAARLEQETGIKHHVDHIIPLQGELVSGLHVENNLQVIPANENLSKSNHYEVA